MSIIVVCNFCFQKHENPVFTECPTGDKVIIEAGNLHVCEDCLEICFQVVEQAKEIRKKLNETEENNN